MKRLQVHKCSGEPLGQHQKPRSRDASYVYDRQLSTDSSQSRLSQVPMPDKFQLMVVQCKIEFGERCIAATTELYRSVCGQAAKRKKQGKNDVSAQKQCLRGVLCELLKLRILTKNNLFISVHVDDIQMEERKQLETYMG